MTAIKSYSLIELQKLYEYFRELERISYFGHYVHDECRSWQAFIEPEEITRLKSIDRKIGKLHKLLVKLGVLIPSKNPYEIDTCIFDPNYGMEYLQ